MNLERKSLLAVKRGARLFFQRRGARLGESILGQNHRTCLELIESLMPSLFKRQAAFCSVKHYTTSRIPTDRQILAVCSRVML
jgi:hypothetical protein